MLYLWLFMILRNWLLAVFVVIYDYAELVLFHTFSGRPCKNCLVLVAPVFHQAKSIPIQMPLTLWNQVRAKEKNNLVLY